MIEDVLARVRKWPRPSWQPAALDARDHRSIARAISLLETGEETAAAELKSAMQKTLNRPPVIGITGTGGAGKSSLTDELLNRFVRFFPDRQIAVVAMDPTRRRSGGALLGDRIRMNALANDQVFMRSLATRRQHLATSAVLADTVQLLKWAGFDLIVVETAGIGQSDSEIVDLVDLSMYVMTSEYGAASQLEKIDMLDFADFVVVNKFEKRGAEDALRDVPQAVAAQSSRPGAAGRRRSARVPDDREPVQRRRRQSAVRGRVQAARRQVGTRAVVAGHRPRTARAAAPAGAHSGQSRALPCRDRAGRAPALVNGSRRRRKPLVVRMAAIVLCRSSPTLSCRRRSIAIPMRSCARPTRRSPACAARTTSRSTRSATTASRN
jgi:putative protein kinase ArgK-like GTPase of G3E family